VNLQQCHGWAAFENVRQKIRTSFAFEVLDWIASGQVSLPNISRCLERAFYQRWLNDVFEVRPQLREFHAVTHEQRIKEFQELDQKILLQNRKNIISTLRSHLQQALQTPEISQQMLDLRSQLRRQRGIMPLRVLMKRCFSVINAIKPCFMMSPQTVAQLLEKDRAKFDLVIFDEASQLPTEDAVGAIIRGDQLVVVGDPKQLPPTNFFAVANGQINVERDEDGELIFQESESILEEVQNSGVPSSRLRWHYRSSNESLITFSNVRFYDSDLFTFPSNETDAYQSGLTFEYVENGVYEGKGLNAIEARRVADAVVKIFRSYPDDSLGVGTFNLRQQLAILDELEVRRREDPSLEKLFDRSVDEPFFVKNLENIQGDERDTIFLSVTYAKALDGRLRYNFGPLNAENGWRRMNVLTSRARKRMTVFSSIRADDIHLEETTSKGAELLHSFLRYAEHRLLDSERISAAAETDSPFEYEVYQELTRRGLHLQPQVGVSGYKIDLGVLDDEVTDRFVCGIECDGVSYHSSETARDRDRLRQQVLERRGWMIHRVWSTDWFKDREGQVSRLLESIKLSRDLARSKNAVVDSHDELEDEAKDKPPTPEFDISSSSTQIQFVLPSVPDYELAVVDAGNFLSFHQTPSDNVARMILQVVHVEAPVHVDDICSRIAGAFGSRAGRRIALRIQGIVQYLAGRAAITTRDGFVYIPNSTVALRRRSGSGIPINRVAPEEIQAAIAMILADGYHFERPILVNHVRSLFGFDRSGPIVKSAVEKVIAECLQSGFIGEGQLGIGLRLNDSTL
jgi:very-short-patch-repair endonuclease